MKGIFAFLKYLDGSYESRYKIEANTSYGVSSDLVKYFDTSEGYVLTSTGKYDINITFQTLFYPTHYSLVNAGSDSVGSHTYNKDWDFVGVDDDNTEFVSASHDVSLSLPARGRRAHGAQHGGRHAAGPLPHQRRLQCQHRQYRDGRHGRSGRHLRKHAGRQHERRDDRFEGE